MIQVDKLSSKSEINPIKIVFKRPKNKFFILDDFLLSKD